MTASAAPAIDPDPVLEVRDIEVVYDGAVLGVADITLRVGRGEIVALLGSNGAGKSTTLKAISGLVEADRAEVTRGDIRFNGESILSARTNQLARRGLVHVLEGRHVFNHLTVEENLRAGTFLRRPSRKRIENQLEKVYAWFPRLATKRKTQAGLTSGGEQQMLAIGRALVTDPELVLLDEPSMGLAPILVQEIFEIIATLNRELGVAFLVAEQNIAVSLKNAHRAYVVEGGRVVLSGAPAELRHGGNLENIYFGLASK